jgi:hypothetical protein
MRNVRGAFKNRVGPQGFVTDDIGHTGHTHFVIENHKGHTEPNVLYVLEDGTVEVLSGVGLSSVLGSFTGSIIPSPSGTLASSVKYEFHDHSGSAQAVPQSPSYVVLACNALHDRVDGGLDLWDETTNAFRPNKIGSVYTIRLTGKLAALGGGGNGQTHIDFALSGALPPNFVPDYNRHKQGYEVTSRANSDHTDIFATFTTFVDNKLLLSGAQFYATTTINGGVLLASMSLFIKEG